MQGTFEELASVAADSQLSLPRLLHVRDVSSSGEGAGAAEQAQRISRDALAHLMNLRGLSTVPHDPLLIDVRRCGVARGDHRGGARVPNPNEHCIVRSRTAQPRTRRLAVIRR